MFSERAIIDDLLRDVFNALLSDGKKTSPKRGAAREIIGALLCLSNPRARLSRTEGRGRAFSAIGELLWYLAGSNELDHIKYYIPQYKKESDDGETLHAAYGPRLFGPPSQFDTIAQLLSERKDTRRAVIQLFDRSDIETSHREVPCTCTLQFLIREEELHLITHMRSNDAFRGLPHDIFAFSMLQEILARKLGVNLGKYHHSVGSLHLYDRDLQNAKSFLEEGFQSTDTPMPPMPHGDPLHAITTLLEIEKAIREGSSAGEIELSSMPPYWMDIARLLLIFRAQKARNLNDIQALRGSMNSQCFEPYIEIAEERILE